MAKGDKPDLSISVKPAGSGKEARKYILSAWKQKGRISSLQLDRNVAAIAVKFVDGTQEIIRKGPDGKMTHYFDAFLRDGNYGEEKGGAFDKNDAAFGGGDEFGGGASDDFPADW
jgi:hypothetical protein